MKNELLKLLYDIDEKFLKAGLTIDNSSSLSKNDITDIINTLTEYESKISKLKTTLIMRAMNGST